MAKRQNKFLIKRSNIIGKIPNSSDLTLGEIALNTADVKMYTSGTTANGIVQIGWDRINRTGDTMTGLLVAPSFSATTYSGGTYYGDGSNLTGITDVYVTGGTYIQSASTMTLTRNDSTDVIISGITNERQILDIYQTGTTITSGGIYSDILWDVNIIIDSDYTHSSSEIIFNKNGYYEINYNLSIDVNSGGRKNSRARIMIDTGGGYVELVRSATYGYHRNTSQGKSGLNKTIRQLFNSGNKIKIQFNRFSGGGTLTTISGDSHITINKLTT